MRAPQLFEQADHALYFSKEHRRGMVTLYSKHHDDLIQDGHRLEAALQAADIEGEFTLHYQPILDLSARRIVLVEGWRAGPARPSARCRRCGSSRRPSAAA